jgi:hypothetical protein
MIDVSATTFRVFEGSIVFWCITCCWAIGKIMKSIKKLESLANIDKMVIPK